MQVQSQRGYSYCCCLEPVGQDSNSVVGRILVEGGGAIYGEETGDKARRVLTLPPGSGGRLGRRLGES